jgi:hypothetical protein
MPDYPVRIAAAEEEIAEILPTTGAVPVQGARAGDMSRVKELSFASKELSFAPKELSFALNVLSFTVLFLRMVVGKLTCCLFHIT